MVDVNSNLYAAQLLGGADAANIDGNLKLLHYTYVHAAGAGDDFLIRLGRIPYHAVMTHPQLGLFGCSAMVSGANVSLGYEYVDVDNAVQADPNFWINEADATSAIAADLMGDISGVVAAGLVPASNVFVTLGGLTITITIDTANIEDGDTVTVLMPYSNLT